MSTRTKTPWGDAEDLRERQLSRRSGASAEEVARSQRERLMAAMVTVTAERGYEAATVADLLARSGVSRSAFYRHFANKEECFGATLGEILERSARAVEASYDGRGSALEVFVALIVGQPEAARLCFVESFAAGEDAVAAMDGAVASFEALVERGFAQRSAGQAMPSELVAAIVGGVRKVIYSRLRRRREAELGGLVEELGAWSFGYQPPPAPLRRRGPGSNGAGGERGELFRPGDPAERLMAAACETVAERGYQAARVEEFVARASVSLSTFYEHFDGKEDVVAATLEAGQAQLLAATLPAYRRARGWPGAVRASFEAMTDFLAAHPSFARLGIVEIFSGTMRALERRDRTIEGLERFLDPGFEQSPETPRIAAEAIGGATYTLIYERIRSEGPQGLPGVAPLMTYIALAPFLGAEEACEVANGAGGVRSRERA
jgi:AcrR family transcriptional regulator